VTHLQSAVLGIVQGATEFLPVSSSGHLVLVPRLLGWPDQGLAFDAAIHVGTLAALILYFRSELWRMLTGLDRRLAVLLIAATIPGGIAGALFEKAISANLRDPIVIASMLIGWGLVMWLADRHAARAARPVQEPREMTWGAAMGVGVAQAIALIPGTSRSGITITAGLFSGLSRTAAARFAFLLGIPITGAAGLLKLLALLRYGSDVPVGPLLTGVVVSCAAGLAAVWFLVNFLERRSLLPFVLYRCALGVVVLAVFGR
jgi:undecaprenyl-diphosphatase